MLSYLYLELRANTLARCCDKWNTFLRVHLANPSARGFCFFFLETILRLHGATQYHYIIRAAIIHSGASLRALFLYHLYTTIRSDPNSAVADCSRVTKEIKSPSAWLPILEWRTWVAGHWHEFVCGGTATMECRGRWPGGMAARRAWRTTSWRERENEDAIRYPLRVCRVWS